MSAPTSEKGAHIGEYAEVYQDRDGAFRRYEPPTHGGSSDGELLAECERRGLLEQVTATLREDLARTTRERDRLLPFVIQKCLNCGAVTAPLVDEEEGS